jgi:hypothetical protein
MLRIASAYDIPFSILTPELLALLTVLCTTQYNSREVGERLAACVLQQLDPATTAEVSFEQLRSRLFTSSCVPLAEHVDTQCDLSTDSL